jgi:hypothetical protein
MRSSAAHDLVSRDHRFADGRVPIDIDGRSAQRHDAVIPFPARFFADINVGILYIVALVATTMFFGGWLRPFPSVAWLAFLASCRDGCGCEYFGDRGSESGGALGPVEAGALGPAKAGALGPAKAGHYVLWHCENA